MRIDKIEIDGFGKLNNFSLTFTDGFNLIFGENESGKSTLCAFLLAMFYELPNDGKRLTLSESARRKYKPWNAERFGGRVYFTHDGKQYILEKTFGATKRSDRSRLMDATDWDECGSAENVGERFFGLGREGFLRTLFVTGFDVDTKGMGNEEILTRLSNLETSGSEDISYSAVQNALEKEQLAILTKTGKGGKLAALKEQQRQLEAELASAERLYESVKTEERRVSALKTQIAERQASLSAAEHAVGIARAHEAYLSQKQTEETRAMLSDRLGREHAKRSELERTIADFSQNEGTEAISEAADSVKRLERELFVVENKKEEKEQQVKMLSERLQFEALKRKRVAAFISSAVFAVFAVTGFVLQAVALAAAVILICVGTVSAGVLFFLLKRRGESKDDIERIRQEFADINDRISELQAQLHELCRAYEVDEPAALLTRAAEEEKRRQKRREAEIQAERCETEIKSLETSLSKLPAQANESVDTEIVHYNGSPSSELDSRVKQLKVLLEQLNREHYELSVYLAKQTAGDRTISDISSEILAVKEQVAVLEKQHAALVKASEWLARAHAEIKQNYAPRLNGKTAELFAKLTLSKYSGVKLGEAFCLNYQNENNEIVDAAFLSGGTYDLLYIALRFASLNVLFGGNVPPVILDDALLQLDDERLAAAAELMVNGGELGQVLYFTCHKAGMNLFRQESVNRIEI